MYELPASSVSAALLLILLTGCAPTTERLDRDDRNDEDSSEVIGVDWHRVAGSAVPTGDQYVRTASAGETLWVQGVDDPFVLYSTDDGVDWRQVDVRDHGVPADAYVPEARDECAGWAWESNGGLFTVYATSTKGSHPGGLSTQQWLVEISDEVVVSAGADVGLENMPPAQDGYDFRANCISGIVEVNGQRMLVGEGMWWQSSHSGFEHGFVAFEGVDGTWTVHASRSGPFFGSEQLQTDAVLTAGDRIVVITGTKWTDRYLYSSVDGLIWEQGVDLEADLGADTEILAASDGERMAIAVVRKLDALYSLEMWTSSDGTTWSSERVFETDNTLTAELVGLGAAGYSLVVSEEIDYLGVEHIWLSDDGDSWDAEKPSKNFVLPTNPTALAGGLVGIRKGEIWVSGLDWGSAARLGDI
jgi:hypothetical protein